ncbi:MAG: hypothetical protein A3G34_06705 [Candidatus Lindowbacteria bacterium RIFCSPLOWO2_12_FULL_62_27]|nr:MAG: hypothetical protein A3G34_06705 [Candidatus Lindowbacteria bacterium RIFCSPLOWO2_12_FULL_62_27]OGH56645.1 MAG: hypothetical protein A3I06_14535 [Candidatus Lindowbacteria bacterium RIFCSPLOWO2_02_FULL_62_12]
MEQWQMQTAKAKLSALVAAARKDGPQEITVHGKPVAVVTAVEDYGENRLTGRKFWDLIRQSPMVGSGIKLERDNRPHRGIKLK